MVRSRAYAWYVLGLLTTINFVNYVDRTVIQGMYGDLRARFHVSDGQIGALTMAFFVVHALTTVPFGWAADRWDRRKVLAAGVLGWSLATLGSAFAFGFVSLLALRSLVGVGEAAYGPIANALLCDTFRPHEKARTVAIFNGGMFAGACVGVAVGGLLRFPLAFQVVAIPGLALGLLALVLDVPACRVARQPGVRRHVGVAAMVAASRRTLRIPTIRWMLAGGILISFAAGGYITWFVDFVERYKGMARERAVVTMGLIALTGGPLGVISGGLVADRLQRRWRFGRTLTMALGFLGAVPFALGGIYIDRGLAFFACAWLLIYFIPWYNGPMAAVIDDVVDDRDASTAQATYTFLLHLCGTGPAAFLVGVASGRWGLRTALLLPTAATALASLFVLGACRRVAADMRARAERTPQAAQVPVRVGEPAASPRAALRHDRPVPPEVAGPSI